MVTIGSIKYSSGQEAKLQIPKIVGQNTYDVSISNQSPIEGVHISSHRTIYTYQQIQNIPTVPRRRNDVFNNYVNILRTRMSGGHTQWSPQYYMKETLIALATFGYGNQAVHADIESATIFEDFQKILKIMLPQNLGFERLSIRVPEVMLETKTGNFPIDALSGGSSAIVDLAWQIFMFQPTTGDFVVTLDEPENHLHPELQRRVLRDLIEAFPTVQFVVATHSPFVVSSVPDSSVYVLSYNDDRSVSSHLLDTANKAGSANEILREVLGVDITIPIWAENQLQELIDRYSKKEFDRETLGSLKLEMNRLGMGNQIPQALASLAEIKDNQ
ncbi:MAG: ATP-binding protein [Proteobacteria bacterium]|nr:MAG: ATP-binding protein [Pseudomonadota bacterium]